MYGKISVHSLYVFFYTLLFREQVLSNTVDDSSNIQNNSSDSSAELEQEVDVSNSLPSNDGDDQCEEDKVQI